MSEYTMFERVVFMPELVKKALNYECAAPEALGAYHQRISKWTHRPIGSGKSTFCGKEGFFFVGNKCEFFVGKRKGWKKVFFFGV